MYLRISMRTKTVSEYDSFDYGIVFHYRITGEKNDVFPQPPPPSPGAQRKTEDM